MAHIPLLEELALIAAIAVGITVIFSRVRLPAVAGLLFAGALLGPYGLSLISDTHEIETLAEVGVVFLLFTIGLEFSLDRMRLIARQFAVGGALQVGLTIVATALVAMAAGASLKAGIFFGFVLSLSSTAIVLRALSEQHELDAPHGRIILATLIFQDLCVVPMVLLVPMLGGADVSLAGILMALGRAALVVLVVVGVARLVVPRVLHWVEGSKSQEVFLLAVLGICIGTAWLTSQVGLSLALGAFLGGVVVAGTEHGHRAMGDVRPLRDAFVSIFFVSLGMLFDVQALLEEPWLVLGLFLGFVVAKGTIAAIVALAMRFPPRIAWLTGIGLGQFGEFGFVLVRLGQTQEIVTPQLSRALLAAGILSMFVTPALMRLAPSIRADELFAPLARFMGLRSVDGPSAVPETVLRDHVVIVGHGLAGRLVAHALEGCGVRYVHVELDAANVRAALRSGAPIVYGDATNEATLLHAHLSSARALVVVMSDFAGARRVLATARRIAPKVPSIVRTKYVGERKMLLMDGATDVVAEELEGGIEVLARLLRTLGVPGNVIGARIQDVRSDLPSRSVPRSTLAETRELDELKIESVEVAEGSFAVARTLAELEIGARIGALVVAIRRSESRIDAPQGGEIVRTGDVVYLIGARDAVLAACRLLTAPRSEKEPA